MTASLFKITPTPPTSIEVEAGREGKFSFTVESLAAPDKIHEIMLQALLVNEDGKGKEADWLVAGPQRTLSLSGGKTATATITAKTMSTTPLGEHRVKLVIAERDRPNDVYADSPAVACRVSAPAAKESPVRKLPWWLIPAIAGGLVLVGGIVLLVVLLGGKGADRPPGLGEPCAADAARACEEGLVCGGEPRTCLLDAGAHCKPEEAKLCVSGECASKAAVCAIPLGAACNPAQKDLVPCVTNGTCDPGKNVCLGNTGAACKADAECSTGNDCAGNVCTPQKPAVKAGDPCDGTCPAPLQCSSTKVCVAQTGQPCSKGTECATGLCESSVCAEAQVGRDCSKDGICGQKQKCIELQQGLSQCLGMTGEKCTSDLECISKWCNGTRCSRDDLKCSSQSDCRPPSQCIAGKQKCLKPLGAACGGNAECDSSFCHQTRCAPSPCNPPCQGLLAWCNNDPLNPKCERPRIKIREGLDAIKVVPDGIKLPPDRTRLAPDPGR